MQPTYGEVFLDGIDAFEDIESARRILGYMPDLAPVPSDLKVWSFWTFMQQPTGSGQRHADANESTSA
jgi:ABC-2 type transport system ATP-binding protein